MSFQKYPTEAFFRYMRFRRADGDGKLTAVATIQTMDYCRIYLQGTTTDLASTMITGAQAYSNNYDVVYKVLGGTSGKRYTIVVGITDSSAQKFEGRVTMEVL